MENQRQIFPLLSQPKLLYLRTSKPFLPSIQIHISKSPKTHFSQIAELLLLSHTQKTKTQVCENGKLVSPSWLRGDVIKTLHLGERSCDRRCRSFGTGHSSVSETRRGTLHASRTSRMHSLTVAKTHLRQIKTPSPQTVLSASQPPIPTTLPQISLQESIHWLPRILRTTLRHKPTIQPVCPVRQVRWNHRPVEAENRCHLWLCEEWVWVHLQVAGGGHRRECGVRHAWDSRVEGIQRRCYSCMPV